MEDSIMNVSDAVNDIVRKANDLDRRHLMMGLPRLAEQDTTWNERSNELRARVVLLLSDGPSQDVLDAIGAHVVAYKRALAVAEEVQVTSGDAA